MTNQLVVQISFAIYALLIVGGGLWAVLDKSLIRALVGLILTLFGVAGMYLLMAAPLIALMQLLIYVGAVVVLIFFAIMLTRAPAGGEECDKPDVRQLILALLGALAPAAALGFAIHKYAKAAREVASEIAPAVLGKVFLEPYVLAFELISVVLFVAMAGAVLLGFERRRAK
ncbi:MAG: NADH-quinone oxidoreductase subunit J [Desulfovibrionaceae bacterium]|nr:NADH-quinone oxidoreductase subunit J [Desulfovibrionaceae bacterium]MBF0512521.1 NADH-quinone oxidoreductase subunit J [Desulfovibrionaceae bacterium]